jgi:uncharacterized protein YprB with RNaseH-like and TPR domain
MTLVERVRRAIAGRDLTGYTVTSLARELAIELDAKETSVRSVLNRDGVKPEEFRSQRLLPQAKMRAKVWDLETTGLKADIGSLLVAAFLDLETETLVSRTILDFDGNWKERELGLFLWTRDQMQTADILIGHNTKAFDRNFMNGVEFRHDLDPARQRFHIDTYHVARYGAKGLFQSCSLSNLADVLGVGAKDRPAKEDWRLANSGDPESMERLRVRCEEDVLLNAAVWAKLKKYWLLWQCRR